MLECVSIDSWECCLMFVCNFLSAEKAKLVCRFVKVSQVIAI